MTIDKLPSGTYRARVYLGKDKSGKKVYKTLTDSDKRRLKRKAAALEAESIQPVGGAMTIGQAITDYIAMRTPVLSPSTISGYRRVSASLEKTDEKLLSTRCDLADIQPFINSWHETGKSYKTILNYVSLISSSVSEAGYSLAQYRLPAKLPTRYYTPSEEEIKHLISAAEGTRLEIPVILGIFGLRRSEICAIHPSDLKGNVLHIQHALVRSDEGYQMKQPKTFTSDRKIVVPEGVADSIIKNGSAWASTPAALTNAFIRLLKNAGLPAFRFHDLRHFFVSYCHNVLRLSDKQIETLGGWSSDFVMKSHYMHSMRDAEVAHEVEQQLSMFVTSGVTSMTSRTM